MLEIFEKFAIELPVTNPVLIFSLVLFVILFAPLILNRFKIPHIIGLILAGVALGEKDLEYYLEMKVLSFLVL